MRGGLTLRQRLSGPGGLPTPAARACVAAAAALAAVGGFLSGAGEPVPGASRGSHVAAARLADATPPATLAPAPSVPAIARTPQAPRRRRPQARVTTVVATPAPTTSPSPTATPAPAATAVPVVPLPTAAAPPAATATPAPTFDSSG